eukprot:GHVS01022138.1.p2 GENE.GHVS01022138.1~~GHVS01022138.1.p2  ORF type:complete len:253 (+),score=46.90 GHVS01022138.1:88-846(+)
MEDSEDANPTVSEEVDEEEPETVKEAVQEVDGLEKRAEGEIEGVLDVEGEDVIEASEALYGEPQEVESQGREASPQGEMVDSVDLAEVILVMTSLGSSRRSFYSSKRAQNLLDCKDVVYFLIDSNRDMSTARDLKDSELIDDWRSKKLLMASDSERKSGAGETSGSVVIPQVLVDGVVIGSETALQDLEEDGDLEWIFARAACPSCLHEKPSVCSECPSCGIQFCSMIPQDFVDSGQVTQVYKGTEIEQAQR